MTTCRVRTGLIGCGKIAATHAMALNTLPTAEFVACCDQDLHRASALATNYNVPQVFDDAETMLRDAGLEAVLICTPHPAHEPLVVAAAEAGIHVLCEKPISIRVDAADRMIDAAKSAGINFGVIFQRRFWPASQRIRQAIDAGKLGKPTLAECAVRIWRSPEYFASDPWRGKWSTEGGGVLMNQAVHAIDLLQWFMGRPSEVYGHYATYRHGAYIDVEDTAVATVVFESGALGTIQAASTVQPESGFRVSVHGDKGPTVSVWEQVEGQQGINDVWNMPGDEATRAVWESDEKGKPGFPLFHELQIQDFLASVIEKRPPAVTGEDARVSLEIIQAIYESSRTCFPVRLSANGI
jgi:UDP-N-acetyl-2-amino-2-deoxyglucuronate dehydrogenase